jgi:hypothetical protein
MPLKVQETARPDYTLALGISIVGAILDLPF